MLLITGVTGTAGSIVIREFAHQQIRVRALVRDSAKAHWLGAFPTVEVVQGDMANPATLNEAFDGVDRTFMISSPRGDMVSTQCRFIDAAKASGVRHVIKLSGKESGTTFDPNRFRGTREHLQIERHLEASGLEWTHLRPSQFMQFYLPNATTGVDPRQQVLAMPIGESQLSPVDLVDVAKVAVAMTRADGIDGRAYDMTGPEALTMTQITEIISTATGRAFRHQEVTFEEKRRLHAAQGFPPEVIDTLDEIYRERANSPQSRVDLSTHEAFGVAPTTFATFAHRNAAAFVAP
ncbi:SDR family oxidoreductase [Mycobacterium sp. URHB0044]|uniref:SDR family oxidoreductase n=1 Tax=Mycobacterium sp. URHB0044 TaxID=1380386 RepID=UPI00048BBCA7|nr:SDR family oxidoreductase [Mycobacterium sp. URHB0044]